MADKSTRNINVKKKGKSLKEKRAAKDAKKKTAKSQTLILPTDR